jgi:cell division protein FtsB
MTARRGSLGFKVQRFAKAPFRKFSSSSVWRRRFERIVFFGSRLVVGSMLLLVLMATGAQFWRIGEQNYRLHRQIDSVEARNAALVDESARLSKEAVLLHDPDYLVPLIHEQLGLTKPHEVFIIVATPAPPISPSSR